jgi:hypothetical protein
MNGQTVEWTDGRERSTRYVVDIDEKKDFLDIIRLALALKSSLSSAENQAELQKETLSLGSFVPAIYPTATKSW